MGRICKIGDVNISIKIDYENGYNNMVELFKEKKIENDKLYETIRCMNREIEKQDENKCCVTKCEPAIDAYSYDLLRVENEKLKQALINIALKL